MRAQRQWNSLRVGFYPSAAAELLRLADEFAPIITKRRSLICHLDLLCLLFGGVPVVRSILDLNRNPEVPKSSDLRYKITPVFGAWGEQIGYASEANDIVNTILKNELHVDSSWIRPLQQSFSNNPQFTIHLFQNVGSNLAGRSSKPLAKLKLRMIYMVSVYQMTLQYETQRRELAKRLGREERLLRDEKSKHRLSSNVLTKRQKDRIQEIEQKINQLKTDYYDAEELAIWSSRPPPDKKQKHWISRLQHYVERRSKEIESEVPFREKMRLFPRGKGAESLICSGKIYQILDEIEDEDIRIEGLGIVF